MGFSRVKKLSVALIIFALLAVAVNARAGEEDVFRGTLPDGMTVLVKEVHSAPVAALQMWVRVGSADEPPEKAGISHVFEHMLFKGTKKMKVGEMARIIESVGGDINAYTSFDNTVYHLVVPSRSFSTGLAVLGDAVQNSSFDPEELRKELEVIIEEIRMNEDSPVRTLYKRIFAKSFVKHPYGRPVIGTMKTVRSLTREDILKVFKTWYVPNNMTLVIVGDVKASEAFEAAKSLFAGFKKGVDPHKKRAIEPVQTTPRTALLSRDINETYMGMAFHIPELKDRDTYAIDMLSSILADGVTSRLYKALKIDSQIVHGVSAYAMSLKDPGLFLVNATLESKKAGKAVKEIVYEIGRLGAEGPNPEEMERARTGLESSFIYSRETMEGTARTLGYYQTIAGDYKYEKEYLDGIKGVTAGDVKEAAKKYFTRRNMTMALITPEKEKTAVSTALLENAALAGFKKAEKFADKLKVKKDIRKVKLPNGMTLIIKEVRTNPTVAMYAAFPGGLRQENAEDNGIGNFTAAMLTRGTKTRSREEIAREVESMAGSLGGFSGRNSTGVTAGFLSRDFDRGLKIYADVIKNPVFPDKEIELLRKDILAGIKRSEDNVPSYTFKLLLKTLYNGHPYGMPVSGTIETVKRIKRSDMEEHYRKLFTPSTMVLTVVGDVDSDYVEEKVREAFGDFRRKAVKLPSPPPVKKPSSVRKTGEIKDKAQTNIALGFLGTTIGSEDSYPLTVLSEVLSGQGGRLFLRLRDKKSLAYSVSAFLRDGVDPGFFGLYIASAPQKKDEALKGLIDEIKRIRNEKVTKAELNRAKNYITGNYEINLQSASSQSSDMANHELYGLGYDFYRKYPEKINSVTADDVLRVAKKYLDLKSYAISVVGPQTEKSE
ncbi:MAG: pitrilysin family protein [Thermodesulfobacteriota bacterium]|nr:MAG: pitrilysin family protein [Thermodesulfobacteriota bacterium]